MSTRSSRKRGRKQRSLTQRVLGSLMLAGALVGVIVIVGVVLR